MNSGWKYIDDSAEQVAAGDMDGDGRDDLTGVWSSGLWVYYPATGKWNQISQDKPGWIATGKMLEAIQTAGSLEDPSECGEELLDMSEEGPGGLKYSDISSDADVSVMPE